VKHIVQHIFECLLLWEASNPRPSPIARGRHNKAKAWVNSHWLQFLTRP
jgi:hypothetical protein